MRRCHGRAVLEADETEKALAFGDGLGSGGALAPVEAAHEHVLARGEIAKGPDELEGARDAARADFIWRQARDVPAAEADAPAVGGERARDEIEERRLAGPVGAHDAEELALLEREADVVDGADAAERFRHPLHLEQN